MQAMTLVWEGDLCDLTDAQLIQALSVHRKSSRYWPTPADILDAYKSIVPNRPPVLSLEEAPVTKEDIRMAGIKASLLVASLNGSKRARDYFETNDPEEREKIAKEVLGSRYENGSLKRHRYARRAMK